MESSQLSEQHVDSTNILTVSYKRRCGKYARSLFDILRLPLCPQHALKATMHGKMADTLNAERV